MIKLGDIFHASEIEHAIVSCDSCGAPLTKKTNSNVRFTCSRVSIVSYECWRCKSNYELCATRLYIKPLDPGTVTPPNPYHRNQTGRTRKDL